MFQSIQQHCDTLAAQFYRIPEERKALLAKIAAYVQSAKDRNLPVRLVYICTHNSRRSHFGQIWSAVAAAYYGVPNVSTYSGGTEATAFHPNAIRALEQTGFEITSGDPSENRTYNVRFGEKEACSCFSKIYSDAANPQSDFAAIMTCSDAEENCPFIPGAALRAGTTYDDPKTFDGTAQEAEKYRERSDQIALETLYTFSLIH
jgi:protein-tyrosine phosphatase/arsenate reductase